MGPAPRSKYNFTCCVQLVPRKLETQIASRTDGSRNPSGWLYRRASTSGPSSSTCSRDRGGSRRATACARVCLSYHIQSLTNLPKAQHKHSRLRAITLSWPKAKLSPFAQLPSHHQYLSIHSILDICYTASTSRLAHPIKRNRPHIPRNT